MISPRCHRLKRWRAQRNMLVIALLATLALAGCQVGPLTIGAAASPKLPTLPHGWSWYHDSVYPFDAPVPPGWQAHGYWFWYISEAQSCARIVDFVPPGSQQGYVEGTPDGLGHGVRLTIPKDNCPPWGPAQLHGWTHDKVTAIAGTSAQRYTKSDENGVQQYVVAQLGGRQYLFSFDYSYTLSRPPAQASSQVALFDTILKDFAYHGK